MCSRRASSQLSGGSSFDVSTVSMKIREKSAGSYIHAHMHRLHQQQFSQQVPGKLTVWLDTEALREQPISAVRPPLQPSKSLSAQPFQRALVLFFNTLIKKKQNHVAIKLDKF